MTKYTQPDDCENSNVSLPKKPNLKGDWVNVFILILLYTLQGVPIGFLTAMPVILKNHKSTTYKDQVLKNFGYAFIYKFLVSINKNNKT